MKIALLAMPWSMSSQPSAAIGALAGYLRAAEPGWTVSARYEYLTLASRITYSFYDQIAYYKHDLGEVLYMPLLYPERQAAVSEYFRSWSEERDPNFTPSQVGSPTWEHLYDGLLRLFGGHLDELVAALGEHDVVGMTTCYGQLYANLALAGRLRAAAPGVRIVLGGSTVSGIVGPSIMTEYPCVDFVVQGEGERPLQALVRAIERGEPTAELRGVLSRENLASRAGGAPLWEVERLDDLPPPDYREYADTCRQHGRDWTLPIEGSRGCWWDRTKRNGNPRSTCYFCNLNVQWGGYREKSVARIVREVDELTDRYQITTTYFLDNIIRTRGVEELARGVAALGKELRLFYEMRANVSSYQLLLLWEAGLREVQIGIEALSSAYLKRIGKGTTTIQNLHIMKTCFELGITHGGNLITEFPGSTPEEVAETCQVIRDVAIVYEPCRISRFGLSINSTVDQLRADFGVANVRNEDLFRVGLPEEVWRRVRLFDLSYDAPTADWGEVKTLCDEWKAAHAPGKEPLLAYSDGKSFLRIVDQRGKKRVVTLGEELRALYLYCTEARHGKQIVRRFARDEAGARRTHKILDQLVARKLMVAENGRYLSLATAPHPQAAARRIRALHEADMAEAGAAAVPATPRPGAGGRLPIYGDSEARV